MNRTLAAVTVMLSLSATPAVAQQLTPPSKAVADAWAHEQKSSMTLKALIGTYGALSGLDVVSTKMARDRGAVEANPIMSGGIGHQAAMKAAMAASTAIAVHEIAKRKPKTAVFTMLAIDAASAAVVANNLRNARRLR
jgi:hypothetical protein